MDIASSIQLEEYLDEYGAYPEMVGDGIDFNTLSVYEIDPGLRDDFQQVMGILLRQIPVRGIVCDEQHAKLLSERYPEEYFMTAEIAELEGYADLVIETIDIEPVFDSHIAHCREIKSITVFLFGTYMRLFNMRMARPIDTYAMIWWNTRFQKTFVFHMKYDPTKITKTTMAMYNAIYDFGKCDPKEITNAELETHREQILSAGALTETIGWKTLEETLNDKDLMEVMSDDDSEPPADPEHSDTGRDIA